MWYLKLLENRSSADVVFKIEDTLIPTHSKLILKTNTLILFSLCDKLADELPVPIKDTNLEVFRRVLRLCSLAWS